MAHFFPRTLYGGHHAAEPGFTPLFRLLEDFDRYSANHRTGPGGRGSHATPHIPTFQPKFDVRETETGYELHGELAGISRDNVHLEFTDPQTMLIRGRVERSYTSGTPPAGLVEGGSAPAGAITESGEATATEQQQEQERPASAQGSHNAKVQDEAEATAEENGGEVAAAPVPEGENNNTKGDTAKYWVSERSIGEFSRTFTFPSRIEQDGIKANLKDGILTVVIPKAKKHEARRIEVS